ncbi:MAG: ribonuclease D [Armatimonadetes bacterium]|nr:ribonuclease D [Armatimonadota bacterium]
MLLTLTHELMRFCDRARDAGVVYLDTEFVNEESYLPRLEVIQLESRGDIAIVDFQALKNPDPVITLLYDSELLKVFHAGRQDLSILHQISGEVMTNTFDTQIAAAFVGYGEQISYGDLVRQICGVSLSKSHTYSSWGRRPLTKEQIEYAQDDVRYLPAVHQQLARQLEEMGRMSWAKEEFEELERSCASERTPSEQLYVRVKGMNGLRPKELAVLRELAMWRDGEAMARNRPIGKILRDEQLVNITRHAPTTLHELKDVRGIPPHIADHYGRGILEAIHKGQSLPKAQWPARSESRHLDPEKQATVTLLQTLIRLRASEEQSSGRLLSSASELEELVQQAPNIRSEDFRVLQGWRYEMIGRDILKLLRGELALGVDAATGRVCVVREALAN